MRWLVLPLSRSQAIGNGLTYVSNDDRVKPGVLVRMKLRGKATQGIVIAEDTAREMDEAKLSPIDSVENELPLLPAHSLQTMQWVANYYRTTFRQAIAVFLPPTPWHRVFLSLGKEPESTKSSLPPGVELTAEQQAAVAAIEKSDKPTLLFGVAGSGKTEIYATLIRQAIAEGKQSILLLPEIFLAEHIVERLLERIPRDQTVILHSQLTDTERRNAWLKVRTGEAAVIIGSRSALFAPCEKLGLVILDEEHEWTYKNEQTPRYHARETAETLCKYAGAKLVLGSATPSIESFERTESGRYQIVRMKERFGGSPFPEVQIVDLVKEQTDLYPCTSILTQAINERLQKKEQTILFLNRRGLASSVLCLDCRKRLLSATSQLPYAVHRDRQGKQYLLDHTTNQETVLPEKCPHCGSAKLLTVGAGTQKLEDILGKLFPSARIARADSDTMHSQEEMKKILLGLQQGSIDILLGTQMVAKGLDLANVTLAAVLVADIGMSLPHFRAGERAFQLLCQLTGRSGRRNPGQVIIQTFRPDAPEIVAASEHRTEDYLRHELSVRTSLGYPPATELVRFILREDGTANRAQELKRSLEELCTSRKLEAFVTASPTYYGGGKEWHVLLRGKRVREILGDMVLTDISIDVDPVNLL